MIQLELLLQDIHQSSRDKVPVPRCYFRQMERSPCLQAMFHIIDNVLRTKNQIRANIAQ